MAALACVLCFAPKTKKRRTRTCVKSRLRSAIIECNIWFLTFLVCSVSLAIGELPLDKYQACLVFTVQDLGGSNSVGSSKIIIFRAHTLGHGPPVVELVESNPELASSSVWPALAESLYCKSGAFRKKKKKKERFLSYKDVQTITEKWAGFNLIPSTHELNC